MHLVDERGSDIALEISLLRELGAKRRLTSMKLFRDRCRQRSALAESAPAVVMRPSEKIAA